MGQTRKVTELATVRGYEVRLSSGHRRADSAQTPAHLLPIEEALPGTEAIVVMVQDRDFVKLLDIDLIGKLMRQKRILDTGGAVNRGAWSARGFRVEVIGAPS